MFKTSSILNIPFFPTIHSAASTAPKANPFRLNASCLMVIASMLDL